MSPSGATQTRPTTVANSDYRGDADEICSTRVLLTVTDTVEKLRKECAAKIRPNAIMSKNRRYRILGGIGEQYLCNMVYYEVRRQH